MTEKRYYVACPRNSFTGGPHLAHQFCRMLLDLSANAKMYYYDWEELLCDWDVSDTIFGKYNTSCVKSIDELDTEDSIIIFPETKWTLPRSFKHAKLHVWWMSVFYYIWTTDWFDQETNDWFKNEFIAQEDTFQFVQSKHAYDYCLNTLKVPEDHIYYLSDYIDEVYLEEYDPNAIRKDIVFYNSAKMSDAEDILKSKAPEFEWIGIENMTKEEIADLFRQGKVYVDFGRHPGKDRIPREAASCGCCVITNRDGAADNDEDIPIPDQYKFDNVFDNIDNILDTIKDCVYNYDSHISDFNNYRIWIKGEKERFREEAKQFLSLTNKTKGDM